jgi:acetyl-CoA carboxylase beta subunit
MLSDDDDDDENYGGISCKCELCQKIFVYDVEKEGDLKVCPSCSSVVKVSKKARNVASRVQEVS